MKTVLVGINSKYIHTCLAIWYLKASVNETSDNSNNLVVTREFTINDNKDNILSEIYKEKPDVLTFSCYIWNIELILLLSKELKKLLPECKIILGGPEVSYDARLVLQENYSIDLVLCGEGEETFSQVYSCLLNHSDDYKMLSGIAYRTDNSIKYNEGFCLVNNLDEIKSPYTAELMVAVANRIVYYESSRGCPFSCSYCISSTFNGVRFFSMDRVIQDLSTLLLYKPKLIKFVDRTFNCNKRRAKEIFEYIIGLNCDTLFHFEAAADLFDDEALDILSRAPKGLIQLEIGIQTINNNTLEEIDRVTDIAKLTSNVKRILTNENIHVHLDLIAGLPYENLKSFKSSFNEVYGLSPHQLQLGFLKLLKGSKIRNEAQKHGFTYRNYTPYEVLYNNYISFEDILLLKDVEEVLERYFNSSRFTSSLLFIEKYLFSDAFELYYRLSVFCRDKGYLDRPISYKENIAILNDFFENTNICKGLIKSTNSESFDIQKADVLHNISALEDNTFKANSTFSDKKHNNSANSLKYCRTFENDVTLKDASSPQATCHLGNISIPEKYSEIFRQKMIFDFLSADRSCSIPEFLKREEDLISLTAIHQLLKNEEFIKEHLPDFIGVQTKNILKSVFFIRLSELAEDGGIIMFDYSKRNLMSEKYRSVVVKSELLPALYFRQ